MYVVMEERMSQLGAFGCCRDYLKSRKFTYFLKLRQ